MGYCTIAEVRAMAAPLTSGRIADATVTGFITDATTSLNRDIGIRIDNELVLPIDNERENDVDGSNTTYYLRKCGRGYGNFIGDRDDSGDVDTDDVAFYSLDSSGTRTSYTTSSIDDDELGKVTLSSAPAGGETLYCSYVYFPLPHDHYLVKKACKLLTVALCFDYLETGQITQWRGQGTTVYRHTEAGDVFHARYHREIDRIISSRIARLDKTNIEFPRLFEKE